MPCLCHDAVVKRLWAGLAVVVVLAACGSSGGSKTADTTTTSDGYGLNSPQSYAYDACQQATFSGGPGMLSKEHATNIEWFDLNAVGTTVTGSGTHYTVKTSVEFENDLGGRVHHDVTCSVTRRPGNRWAAEATTSNFHTVQ